MCRKKKRSEDRERKSQPSVPTPPSHYHLSRFKLSNYANFDQRFKMQLIVFKCTNIFVLVKLEIKPRDTVHNLYTFGVFQEAC